MSTNINITVGDNALLDRAKQQQAASRQAQLNRENSTRLEAQATAARTAALSAQGRDANGQPLYGVNTTLPEIERRPAAFRGGDKFDIGHCWIFSENPEYLTAYERAINFDIFIPAVGGFRGAGTSVMTEHNYGHVPTSNFLCGTGQTGNTLSLPVTGYDRPTTPPNTFAPTCTYFDEFGQRLYSISPMEVITASAVNWGFAYFLLPAGKDKYILIQQGSAMYGQSVGTHTFWNVEELPLAGRPITGIYPAETDFGFPRYWAQGANIGTCLVPTATGYQQHIIKTNYALSRKAFICSNTSIREVSMPTTLGDILKVIYPDPSIVPGAYGTNGFRSVSYSRDYYTIPFSTGRSDFVFSSGSNLLSIGVAGASYTPEIFDTLNFYQEYSSTIKPTPTGRRYRMADMATGGYAIYNTGAYSPPYATNKTAQLYANGTSFYYTTWPNKDQAPDFRTFDAYWDSLELPKPKAGKKKLDLSPARPTKTYEAGEEIKLACVYDWNDSAYCVEQLKLLGFSDADLTP